VKDRAFNDLGFSPVIPGREAQVNLTHPMAILRAGCGPLPACARQPKFPLRTALHSQRLWRL